MDTEERLCSRSQQFCILCGSLVVWSGQEEYVNFWEAPLSLSKWKKEQVTGSVRKFEIWMICTGCVCCVGWMGCCDLWRAKVFVERKTGWASTRKGVKRRWFLCSSWCICHNSVSNTMHHNLHLVISVPTFGLSTPRLQKGNRAFYSCNFEWNDPTERKKRASSDVGPCLNWNVFVWSRLTNLDVFVGMEN